MLKARYMNPVTHQISVRYAKALFAQAQLHGTLTHIENAAAALRAGLSDASMAALANPTLAREDKASALLESLKNAPELLKNFITLMLEDNRADVLPMALHAFQTQVDVANQHVRAKVTSVTELTEAQRKALTAQAQKASGAKRISLEENIDASLIGGLRLQVGSKLWDTSLQTKLQTLQNKLQNA